MCVTDRQTDTERAYIDLFVVLSSGDTLFRVLGPKCRIKPESAAFKDTPTDLYFQL